MFLYRCCIAVAFIIFPCHFKTFLSVLFQKDRGSLEGKSEKHHHQCLVQGLSVWCEFVTHQTPSGRGLYAPTPIVKGEGVWEALATPGPQSSLRAVFQKSPSFPFPSVVAHAQCWVKEWHQSIIFTLRGREFLDHPLHTKSHGRTDTAYSGWQYHEVRVILSPVSWFLFLLHALPLNTISSILECAAHVWKALP